MARWEPDGRARLVAAALDLFAERGYDEVTVAEIAERAGLTRSTFFRYFPDKRDVLAAGQAVMSRLLVEGIAGAPEGASPLDAVAAGLDNVSGSMTSFNRELAPRVRAVIASSAELQARDQLKHVSLVADVAAALQDRGVPDSVASLAAEIGMLAFRDGFATWTASDGGPGLVELVREALARLRGAVGALG
ncbi:TetR/AcrR family transcriptional regulator [Cellulomonas sp. SG140]|uniref:TetR/AcrR family transcriptional regulator n=1 Tax=Cellulomonas sp. SG140 TaxID=2976536 RepID=UPI0021E85EB6|nr:TetR family transcriptional regulator [Cellulomonas sp. SG140]